MGLGNVKDQTRKGLVRWAQRQTLAEVRKGRIRRFIRQACVRGNSTDGAVDHKARRTVSSHHNTKLPNGCMGIAATEFSITARDWTDPAFLELRPQKIINELGMIEGRLPSGIAMLKGDDLHQVSQRTRRRSNSAIILLRLRLLRL